MSKIGIYGGTFDPIHHGHLILARATMEQLALDEMIFIPAAVSPHKGAAAPTDGAIRLEMLRQAIAQEPPFSVDDRELRRPPPSYTIDTIEGILAERSDTEIFYCVGGDNVARLHTWHRFDELQALVTFVILDRGEHATNFEGRVIEKRIDISSTEIRKRVAMGLSIRSISYRQESKH